MVAYTTLRYASHTYEIATQPIDGFDCQRLTRNDWDDVSPAWSPDGSRIAFVSHRKDGPRLFTITPDGADERSVAPTVRVQTDPPAWSPDGSLLAFVGEEEEIVSLTWLDTYFTPPVTKVSENWSLLREAVYVASTDGSSVRKLVWADATDAPPLTRVGRSDVQNHAEENVTHFQWSPDGSQIAFVALYHPEPSSLYIANLDTAEVQQVLDLTTILEAEQYHCPSRERWYNDGSIRGIAWSPDGSQVIIEVGGAQLVGDFLKPVTDVYTIAADGSEPPLSLDEAVGHTSYLDWPNVNVRGMPHPFERRRLYGVFLNYLEWVDSVAGTAPARIVRYTDSMNANVWAEVKGWLLTTIPWDGSGEKLLVRIVDNRLVAARPRQDDASTAAAQCSEDQVVPGAQQNPGLVKDCRVLLGMRDVLAGDGVLYWSADFPIQEWPGVTVAGSPPRVHALTSVPGVSLTGIIPPEIGELRELRVLNLEDNEFKGSLPAELGSLVNLEILDLGDWAGGYNNMTGGIPLQLGNLSNLKVLDLSGNDFDGPIPPELSELAKLEELHLESNPLQGNIPSELGTLKNLEVLTLGGARTLLVGTIPPELGNLENLRELTITCVQLTGSIPPELGNLSHLRKLRLEGCYGSGGLIGPIPRDLTRLEKLTSLNLANNDLEGPIPSEIGAMARLTYVNLLGNRFTGCVPTELRHIREIRTNLAFCQ